MTLETERKLPAPSRSDNNSLHKFSADFSRHPLMRRWMQNIPVAQCLIHCCFANFPSCCFLSLFVLLCFAWASAERTPRGCWMKRWRRSKKQKSLIRNVTSQALLNWQSRHFKWLPSDFWSNEEAREEMMATESELQHKCCWANFSALSLKSKPKWGWEDHII